MDRFEVPTTRDDDGDGKPDTIVVDVLRPKTPDGVKVPIILVASPYYATAGRGPERQIKQAVTGNLPLFYDDYFVPRGYAVAAMDTPGTGESEGCMDVLGPADIGASIAVVEFLQKQSWATPKVAMVGKSYDGSLAIGVAAAKPGLLAAIVPIASITSTYHYGRIGGAVRLVGWPSWYAETVQSPEQNEKCTEFAAKMDREAEDSTGNKNSYWSAREFLTKPNEFRTPALIAHGLLDWNVHPDQSTDLWKVLRNNKVPAQLWLSMAGHADPFDTARTEWIKATHQWFDHFLLGLNNGVEQRSTAMVQAADFSWTAQPDWPTGSTEQTWHLGERTLSEADQAPATLRFTDTGARDPSQMVASPERPADDRQAFLSDPLTTDLHLSGTAQLTVNLAVRGAPRALLSAVVVDYGKAESVREFGDLEGIKLTDEEECVGPQDSSRGCFKVAVPDTAPSPSRVLARGWLDLQHRSGFERQAPIVEGRVEKVTVPFTPTDRVIPKGHRLGLVIFSTDLWMVAQYSDPCRRNDKPGMKCPVEAVEGTPTFEIRTAGSVLTLPTG